MYKWSAKTDIKFILVFYLNLKYCKKTSYFKTNMFWKNGDLKNMKKEQTK